MSSGITPQQAVEALQALKIAIYKYGETYAPTASPEMSAAVKLELGDTLLTLIRTAERLNVDLIRAAEDKVQERAANFPQLVRLAKKGGD